MGTGGATPMRQRMPAEIRVLVGAAFLIAIGYGLIAPVLPQYARGFDVGVTAASVVVSVFAFARLVFAPAGGRLVGRFGGRPVYLAGLVIVALSSLAAAAAQTYWQLLLFRGLGGLGSTMFTVSAMGLLVRMAPPGIRGRVSSAYASAFLLGGIAGPVLGGLLADLGMRVPFVVYAFALLVAAGIVAVRIRPGGEEARDAAAAGDGGTPLVSVLRDSAYRSALASAFANGWANFGVRMAILPQFAAAVGMGADTVGLALAAFALGNAAVLQFSGRLADSLGRKPLIVGGLVVSGLATIVLGMTGDVATMLVASVVAGAGAGGLNPAQQATVADVVADRPDSSRFLAMFQMSADAGAIVGPVLVGVVADLAGYSWAFGITGAITLVAAAVWLPARETLVTRGAPTSR